MKTIFNLLKKYFPHGKNLVSEVKEKNTFNNNNLIIEMPQKVEIVYNPALPSIFRDLNPMELMGLNLYFSTLEEYLDNKNEWVLRKEKPEFFLSVEEESFLIKDMSELVLDAMSISLDKNRNFYGISTIEYDSNRIVLGESNRIISVITPTFTGMACRLSQDRLGRDIFYDYQLESHNVFKEEIRNERNYFWDDLHKMIDEFSSRYMSQSSNIKNSLEYRVYLNGLRSASKIGEKLKIFAKEAQIEIGHTLNGNRWNGFIPDFYWGSFIRGREKYSVEKISELEGKITEIIEEEFRITYQPTKLELELSKYPPRYINDDSRFVAM